MYKGMRYGSCAQLIMIDIYMKFHEDSLNGFQIKESRQFCDRPTDMPNFISLYRSSTLTDL